MPNRSREKGNREERNLVRLLQDAGFAAERVPLSGASGGRFSGDLTVPLMGRDLVVEVKVKSRGDGFKMLYEWLEGRDALIVKTTAKSPLVVVPIRLAVEIAKAAEKNK